MLFSFAGTAGTHMANAGPDLSGMVLLCRVPVAPSRISTPTCPTPGPTLPAQSGRREKCLYMEALVRQCCAWDVSGACTKVAALPGHHPEAGKAGAMEQIRLRVMDAIRSNDGGLNQAAIARQASMTQDGLSRSLSGQRNFSAGELAALAKILRVSLQWLVTGDPRGTRREPADWDRGSPPIGTERPDRVAETVAFPAGAYREVGLSTPSVPAVEPGTPPEVAAAEAVRGLAANSPGPFIHDLPAAIEHTYGIGVFVVGEGPAFDARAMATSKVTYVVVRGTGAWYQANLVLARELGELVGGRQSGIGRRRLSSDNWSTDFAYSLLLPEAGLRSIDWNRQTPRELADFLWEAGVSAKALTQRLESLDIQPGPALVHADEGTLQLLVWQNPRCLSHPRARAYRAPRIPYDLFNAHLKGMREGHVDGTSLAWMLDTPLSEL